MLEKPWYRSGAFWVTVVVFAAGVVMAKVTYDIATAKDPDSQAIGLAQAMTLLLTLVSGFVFGRVAGQDVAADVIKPHTRSAFRRVWGLYIALVRFRSTIQARLALLEELASARSGVVEIEHIRSSLDVLEAQVVEQIGTASDALDDWRDIVPSEVQEVEEQLGTRGGEPVG